MYAFYREILNRAEKEKCVRKKEKCAQNGYFGSIENQRGIVTNFSQTNSNFAHLFDHGPQHFDCHHFWDLPDIYGWATKNNTA